MPALIGYPNRVDSATLSGGSWTLALTNVQDSDMGVVARSSDVTTASTTFDIDLGAAYPVRVIMVYVPNATRLATCRVWADDESAFIAPPFDTGIEDVYPTGVFPASTSLYGEDVSSDRIPAELFDEGLRYPYIHIPTADQDYRYWRVAIDDTANPDGYLDVARVFIGTAYRPSVSWQDGGRMAYASESDTVRTQAGKKRGLRLPSHRTARFTLPNVPEDEGAIQCLDIMRRINTTEQFAFVFDESDTTHLQRRSYLAHLSEVDRLSYPASVWQDVPFSITEDPTIAPHTIATWTVAYLYQTGGRYSVTTDPTLAGACFALDNGRLKIQDPLVQVSRLAYVNDRLTILTAPTLYSVRAGGSSTTTAGNTTIYVYIASDGRYAGTTDSSLEDACFVTDWADGRDKMQEPAVSGAEIAYGGNRTMPVTVPTVYSTRVIASASVSLTLNGVFQTSTQADGAASTTATLAIA